MVKPRCAWVTDDPLYISYHDEEWGNLKNIENDHYLFEMLILEGAQAGLNWLTILRRRGNYRRAFAQFNPAKVAEFTEAEIEKLMLNEGIIRNRRKITSTIQNAQAFLQVQAEFGSFYTYLWDFIDGQPIRNEWRTASEVPTTTDLAKELSKELKRRGFSFVGPIICYAYMQAIGLVDDHTLDCFLRK